MTAPAGGVSDEDASDREGGSGILGNVPVNPSHKIRVCQKFFERIGEIQMKQFRTMLLGSAAMSMAAMAAMPAEAAEVERTLKMSGYVNKVAAFVHDGNSTYTDFADSGLEKSRVRWIGEAKGPDFTMGGIIELGLMVNNSRFHSQAFGQNGGTDTGTLEGRRAAVYIKSKRFGTLNLGKYQSASDGSVEADLSGTDISAINGEYAGIEGAPYRFLQEGHDMGGVGGTDLDGDAAIDTGANYDERFPAASININNVLEQLDGILQQGGRPNGIRYTSPSFMGASVRFGAYEGGSTDVAIHYSANLFANTIYDIDVDARFAAYNTAGTSATSHGGIGGSISVLHSSGVNLTFAGAEQDYTARATQTNSANLLAVNQTNTPHSADDPTNMYVKAGYKLNYFNIGNTNFSGSWAQTEDIGGTDQTVEVFGLNIVQEFDAYGTEIYGGYANFDLEVGTDIEYEDIDAGWVGMRVKF
ncbi:MAG: hypothetical protein QF583_06395 [Rhodospirillales bacterium]|nr:hypothetical protein [Rhodospirillales bacterium]